MLTSHQSDRPRVTSSSPAENVDLSKAELVGLIEQRRKDGTLIEVSPLGFLRLRLTVREPFTPGLNMHIWSDCEIPIPKRTADDEKIHPHNFDLESRILCGAVTNGIYSVRDDPAGSNGLFEVRYRGPITERIFLKPVSVSLFNETTYRPGEKYAMTAGQFHTSITEGPLTATLMRKYNINLSVPSVMVAPIGPNMEITDHKPFDNRKFDQKIGWQLVERVIAKLQ